MGDLTQAQAKETLRPDEESVLAEAQPLWTPRRMLSDLSPRPDGGEGGGRFSHQVRVLIQRAQRAIQKISALLSDTWRHKTACTSDQPGNFGTPRFAADRIVLEAYCAGSNR